MVASRIVIAAVLGLLWSIRAEAGLVIGVNFTGGGQLLAPGDSPGVVAGGFYTNISSGPGSTVTGLTDSSGAVTSTSLTVNSGSYYDGYDTPSTPKAATNTMYSGGLFGLGDGSSNSQASVTLNNISFARYDVYVYASADTSNTNTISDTIGGTSYYYASGGNVNSSATSLLPTTSTDPLSPTVGPAQYQVFAGLTESSFTLTASGSITGIISSNIFGIEIVDTAVVPEPSSLTLSGLGVAAGLGYWLRRRRASA